MDIKALRVFASAFHSFLFFDSFLLPSYFFGNQRLFHHLLGLVGLFVKLFKNRKSRIRQTLVQSPHHFLM